MDSVPILVLSGQVSTPLIGNDAFQEADIVGITRPCTKHNYLVKDIKDLGRILKEAFYIARSGRPGPVFVDLPKDVSELDGVQIPEKVSQLPTHLRGPSVQIQRASRMMKSKNPSFTGGGIIAQRLMS
jgi:acetolactate synthase-1/2/3 large subunit